MSAWTASLSKTARQCARHTKSYANVHTLSGSTFTALPLRQLLVKVRPRHHTAAVYSKLCTKMSWKSLQASRAELTLNFTLPTGQSFRWRRTAPDEFTGVVDSRVVKIRQMEDDVEYQVIARGAGAHASDDAAVLKDYFNLKACLSTLCKEWSERDQRYRSLHQYFPGARVLRQDPVECLFEFICSSNNHISRIHGMVERLCRDYGTPLLHQAPTDCTQLSASNTLDSSLQSQALKSEASGHEVGSTHGGLLHDLEAGKTKEEEQSLPDLAFYAFPTLQQLSKATEAALRAEGFGYRAKFITGSVAMLLAKPDGGREWLLSLRDMPYREASEALCELPGIGPKVAACVCLFALDKHEAIPVDTHVWQLALRYYTPHLKGKTMNKKIMQAVEDAFIDKFGPWAGWAHNTLFISELATQQQHLPEHLRAKGAAKSSKSKKAVKAASLATVPKDDNGLQGTSTANPDAAADPGPKKRRRSNDTSGLLQHTEEDEIKPVSKKRKVASKAETQLEDKDADGQSVAALGSGSTAELTDEQALSPAADQAPPRQVQLQQRRIASKQAGRRTRSSAAAALISMDQVASAASVTLH